MRSGGWSRLVIGIGRTLKHVEWLKLQLYSWIETTTSSCCNNMEMPPGLVNTQWWVVLCQGETPQRTYAWCCRNSYRATWSRADACVAESMSTNAGRFSHIGLCQLRTKLFCTQLTTAYVAETSCFSCYWFWYAFAHNQFTQFWQHSNEPLQRTEAQW